MSDRPDTIIEIVLDSGTVKYGFASQYSDVKPAIKSISYHHNKIDPKNGYGTKGQMRVVLTGRNIIIPLVRDNYLKNRLVNRKEGYIENGYLYSEYTITYTGYIIDWNRNGDELTLIIADDLAQKSNIELPIVQDAEYGLLDYMNKNPVDIILDIIKGNVVTSEDNLAIPAGRVNTTQFDDQKERWFEGYAMGRVLVKPEKAKELLNQLQIETNSFVFFEKEKISFKAFMPLFPGESTFDLDDTKHISHLTQGSGYEEFANKIIVYFDYDESGNNDPKNFETWYIWSDADSQGSGQMNEVKEKTIKSKWIRTFANDNPAGMVNFGIILYHISKSNGAGTGTITWTYADKTLQWTPPGETIGVAVVVEEKGEYELFSVNEDKIAKVAVTPKLAFTSGGTYEVEVGDTITGATSAVSQKVVGIELTSGSWGAGTAAGYFILEKQTVIFQSENVDVDSNSNVATIAPADDSWTITITALAGQAQAAALASRLGRRYTHPPAKVTFRADKNIDNLPNINLVSAQFFNLTTLDATVRNDEAVDNLTSEEMMILEVNPNQGDYYKITALQTKFDGRYGVISDLNDDYDGGDANHNYAYIADSNNLVGAADDEPYLIS